MMPASKSVYLETMGCQMNALDSELILGELMGQGYCLTDDLDSAKLVILNTCSVRQHAEDKVYSRLGQLRRTRGKNPEQIVAVVGCMAERDGDGLFARVPHVDILCGPNELHRLTALIEEVRQHRRRAVALSGRLRDRSTTPQTTGRHEDLESLDSGRSFALSDHAPVPKVFGRYQAYVRITRGCNKFCSFCVVPYVRGPEVHRPPDSIVQEVRRLADAGVVEVTLLGQTVNHYHYEGDGPGGATSFAALLRRVHDEAPHLPRLRFVTSFPRDFDDEALRVMAESPRICRYLHIPAQSGSDRILKRMNRGYTVAEYRGLLDRARKLMPDISIAGDMMVGFSGETEEDFSQSLDLLRYARYKNCFIFKYSSRPGTHADARLPDDVPDDVKRRRNNDMLAVQAEINLAHHREMIGQAVEVLAEGPSKSALKAQRNEESTAVASIPSLPEAFPPRRVAGGRCTARSHFHGQQASQKPPIDQETKPAGGTRAAGESVIDRCSTDRDTAALQLVGRTRGDQIVVVDGTPDMVGRLVPVRITSATPYTLHGESMIRQVRG